MAAVDFVVKNGIVANTYVSVGNSTVNAVVTPTSFAVNGTISVGNSSVNAAINSTSVAVNTISVGLLYVNGATNTGSAGYILYSGGPSANAYWGSTGAVGTNVSAQFAWTNTQSFSNTVTFNGTVSSQANTLNQTLTDAATITWDVSAGQIATVTLGGNRTIAAPTNLKVTTYLLHVIQDGTGSRTLTWNSVFKWPAGTAPPLTTTAAARDIFSFVSDGTNLYGSFLPNVK